MWWCGHVNEARGRGDTVKVLQGGGENPRDGWLRYYRTAVVLIPVVVHCIEVPDYPYWWVEYPRRDHFELKQGCP